MTFHTWRILIFLLAPILLFLHIQLRLYTLISFRADRTILFSKSPETPWVLFYNVYIDPAFPLRAHQIMEEQIGHIGGSFVASNPKKPVIVYYNSIGAELNHVSVKQMCWMKGKIRCEFLEHFDEAFEEVTLSRVAEFCLKYPGERVTYMHNKGSLHEKEGENSYWRRSLTTAVTSLDCLKPPNGSCNVCGLLFNMLPYVHAPGNFWTAQCSYINKLLPPKEYKTKVEKTHQELTELRKKGKITIDIYGHKQWPWRFGTGRYTNEMWIGSHPEIIPCDLSPSPNINFWRQQNRTLDEMTWSMAPRFNVMDVVEDVDPPLVVESIRNASMREREYSLLPGMLYKWHRLYEKLPPRDSFFWRVFPEGGEWLERVKHFGNDVVDKFVTS